MTDNPSVWDSDVVKGFEGESSGGGGWVCYTNIELGYKVFARNHDNSETFFSFSIEDENDKSRAKTAAQKFVDTVNTQLVPGDDKVKAPTSAIRIELDKQQVYGRDVSTWSGNRIQDTPVWTDAYKKIISPHLKEAGADLGWQWARIALEPDPYKPTRLNRLTGETVANLVMYVAEVYLNKQEALDAAAETSGGSSKSSEEETSQEKSFPEGYDAESWGIVIPLIKQALADGQSIKEVADDYGVGIPDVAKLK